MDQFNLFKNLPNFSLENYADKPLELLKFLANLGYNTFFLLSVIYFGYKIANAFYIYYTRASHPVNRVQLKQEIMEPVKGLVIFVVALSILKILFGLVGILS